MSPFNVDHSQSTLTAGSVDTQFLAAIQGEVHPTGGAGSGPISQLNMAVRDDEHLAAASGSGPGLMDYDTETSRYIGRGAGALYVFEEDEVEVSIAEFTAK